MTALFESESTFIWRPSDDFNLDCITFLRIQDTKRANKTGFFGDFKPWKTLKDRSEAKMPWLQLYESRTVESTLLYSSFWDSLYFISILVIYFVSVWTASLITGGRENGSSTNPLDIMWIKLYGLARIYGLVVLAGRLFIDPTKYWDNPSAHIVER